MKLGITILGSGSKGNSILIHTDSSAILIDAGFSRKEMLLRIDKVGVDPAIIKAILVTHNHGDHVKGLRVLADQLKIPAYVNSMTFKELKSKNLIGQNVLLFDTGNPFEIDQFYIQPFNVPHDALEPVGFSIFPKLPRPDDLKIGIATDLGHLTNLVKTRLQNCDALILESNYDHHMLRKSERKLSLKQRISGKFGHLNNCDAIDAFDSLLSDNMKHLFLYHLSDECNTPEIVEKLASEKLINMGRNDINCLIASQDEPLETVWL